MKLKQYTIRLCRYDEYEKLVDFFRKYWSENHVFCRNRRIFEFQHGDASEGEYDFIIAVHNETDEIHAVLGFISSSRYDGGDRDKPISVAGAIWKVRDDVHNTEIGKLGLGVLYYLLKKFPDSSYITTGLSGFSQEIYQSLHFDFGVMMHYYVASKDIFEFKIAENPMVDYDVDVNPDINLDYLSCVPDNFDSIYYPIKNKDYIKNRYIEHPYYKYNLLGVYKMGKLKIIWITRNVDINGHRCVRLVDMIGDMSAIMGIRGNIQDFLNEEKAEYIDCYNYGISKDVFLKAGFSEVGNETVIPNYFEPFEKRNVDIHYAVYSKKPVVLFKGDCDQDRPNLLEL